MTDGQIGAVVTFGGIALVAAVVTALDWWAQRQQRRHQRH
jgi:hypothetical protein